MKPPVSAMELEDGVHATLKFHLPWRLIRGGAQEWCDAETLVCGELGRLMTALREGTLKENNDG